MPPIGAVASLLTTGWRAAAVTWNWRLPAWQASQGRWENRPSRGRRSGLSPWPAASGPYPAVRFSRRARCRP